MPQPSNPTPSRKRSPAIVSVALLLCVSLAAGAGAQFDAAEQTGLDTQVTPAAKETTAWASVAGATFGVEKYPPASPTPIEAEFYTVAFENDLHGFAGGMRCKVAPPSDLKGADLDEHLRDCPGGREPVIYEYVQTETESSWHEVLPPEGSGYVGSIAFMPDGRALAVGGTGEYPRREQRPSTAASDVAGDARAWLYDDGFWVSIDAQLPDDMRGLTALAMSSRIGDCVDDDEVADRSDCGLAGGYQQLWLWKDGEFVKGYGTSDEPAEPLEGQVDLPANFRFRVRDIDFVPGSQRETKAVAVTSGCCAALPVDDTPAVLVFDGDKIFVKDFGARNVAAGQRPVVRRDVPDTLYSVVMNDNGGRISVLAAPGGPRPEGSPAEGTPAEDAPLEGTPVEESPVGESSSRAYGTLGTPTPQDPVVQPGTTDPLPNISNLRLTGAAGQTVGVENVGGSHMLDWAVGSRTDTGQAVAYSTDEDVHAHRPNVLSCPGEGWPFREDNSPRVTEPGTQNPDLPDLQCQPYDAEGLQGELASRAFFVLKSYRLNAMTFSDPTESVGWAVGDRGAIVRLGGVGTTSSATVDRPPAKLGAGTTARFAGSDVYDAFRPLPTDGDTPPVPSLASNGTTDAGDRTLVPGGSPNPTIPRNAVYPPEDVSSVVMSPDGSEGWAIGAGPRPFTSANLPPGRPGPILYHYDGLRWSRCDIKGVPGRLPADPACASLTRLFGTGSNGTDVALLQAVRVPLENDPHPDNDDEFEVAAIGQQYIPGGDLPSAPVLVRYRNGEWQVDETAQTQLTSLHTVTSIAFTSPTDGWIASGQGFSGPELWHWDGQEWVECSDATNRTERCGDAQRLLPFEGGDRGSATLAVAGRRIYLAANRLDASGSGSAASTATGAQSPAILYKDPDGRWTAERGGYDPGCTPQPEGGCAAGAGSPETRGKITSFTVAKGRGGYQGWALGRFGTNGAEAIAEDNAGDAGDAGSQRVTPQSYYLLRLQGESWEPYTADDASSDYVPVPTANMPRPVILDPETGLAAIYRQDTLPVGPGALLFEPTRGTAGRWRVFPTPFSMRATSHRGSGGYVRAVVPDGAGGAWLVGKQRHSASNDREGVHFWRWTNKTPKPIFEEAPHPIREAITGSDTGPDGSLWVTTNSGFVYRYDRLTGWERLRIPGWDPGRVVTKTSEANAVAVGPDGEGVVVGKNGRMAQVSPLGVQLDPAAGKTCGDPPCGTAADLRAAAVAPDGSALAGGESSVLLYRAAGQDFRKIPFGGSEKASITSITMPSADRAWLTNSLGQVYAGTLASGEWTFAVENRTSAGDLLTLDELDNPTPLRAIEIDRDGEGYAVGERGLILERRGDGGWQRLKTRYMDTFRSVALAPQGRDGGALIGGDMGLVLTLEDGDFRVAREADLFDPVNFGNGAGIAANVLGVEIVPGVEAGQMEAWAVQQVPVSPNQSRTGPGTILHYTSDPDHSLMRPANRIEPLPDSPEPREGEISFAAFGRSDCHASTSVCPEGAGSNLFHEVVSRRVTTEIIGRSKDAGGPTFAVFTGDVGRAGGKEEGGSTGNKPLDKSWVHRRWTELVADRFADAEVPLFGAVGLRDLDRTAVCTSAGSCPVDSRSQAAGTGLTSGWRRAMAAMLPPWGVPGEENKAPEPRGFSFDAVEADVNEEPAIGGARTHYAVDIAKADRKLARLIVLDNSMRTLASSDPNQNPVEPDGQTRWLERMLDGAEAAGEQPIVVMNTPTYSYGAGDPTSWAGDAAVLEQTFIERGVKMVVSGRLGWNGRYWATAAGVHHPCPEGDYMHDDSAPQADTPPCAEQTGAVNDPATAIGNRLSGELSTLGAPAPPGEEDVNEVIGEQDTGLQGVLPFVVASSAGGTFGPDGTEGGSASDGWWHGYTIVRMDESGDPAKTIVEQRPVFDWISITAPTHVLKPRQRMTLRGEGREPVGIDVPARYDAINSPAITHRYDLVMADERNPSIPRRDENGKYVEVPTSVGRIDRQTGVVTAGAGRQERTYTVAILSVGKKAAGWPIAFEPSKSFKPRPVPEAKSSVIQTPARPAPARPLPPPPVVLNSPPAPTPPPTPPANIPQVNLPTLQLPSPPALPNIPGLPGGTPTPAPPPPAAPPAPPGSAGALPLTLEAPITPISIVPTVIPPAPPPVNPAPPSGGAARKEARQRQAATAKSEEGGGDQGAGEGQSAGDSGSSSEMTRRDRTRPAPSYDSYRRDDTRYSFTAVSQTEQASAWSRGALYGGMSIATALVLALGWGIARPTPKRRHPPRAAPGTVRERPRQ